MPHDDLHIARYVEQQMRNWEIGRAHEATQQPSQVIETIHPYVAISREFDPQADRLAEDLCQCLGWPKFDREILDYMAEKADVRHRLYELLDERERNWLQQLIDLLEPLGTDASLARGEYFGRLTRAIVAIAQQQSAIFVGRGANFILPRNRGLAVRIIAPLKDRVQRLRQQEGLDDRTARRRLRDIESRRADFLASHFGSHPYDPRKYDLILNAGTLGVPDMSCLVRLAAERKLNISLPCRRVLV